jgi:hypothetical protein
MEEREKGEFSPSSLSSFLPFLLSSLLLLSFTPKHDYHVSVTQMQYNPAARSC